MRSAVRFALLAASTLAAPAVADDAAPGDYLPADIVVTGTRDGYSSSDGSSGTKTPTPLIDVPQTISILTEDQLDDQATTQLSDALRYIPGVTLDTGEGHRDQVFIRGQASTADFYLDGLRDDAEYYRPLYNVARVEVLKGANALVFGRGGGGGVINRVSKTAGASAAAIGLDAGIDSFGAFNLSADVNQPLGGTVAARVNATYEELDNARDFYSGRFFGISPTITAALNERTRISAFYTYDDDRRVTDRGVPSLGGAPLRGYDRTFFGDPAFNDSRSRAHIARVRLDHELSEGLSFNLTGQFADHDKFYANVVPASATATTATLNGYTSGANRRNRIVQGNLVWERQIAEGIESTLLAGFEAGRQDTDAVRSNIAFAGGATTVTVALARKLAVPAAMETTIQRASSSQLDFVSGYVQEQLDLGPVQLVAGLRYDEFSLDSVNLVSGQALARTDRKWSPRAGIVLKPVEAVSVYASYATTFLPQSGDQFSVLDATTASLRPEKFENLELGAKYAITPGLFASAALFRLDRSNTRAADPANPGLTVLTGASRVEGFEASLVGRIRPNLQASLGYTLLDGEIRSATTAAPAGRRLPQVPRHQASAWTRYDFGPLGIGLGAIYQAKQFASTSNAVTLPAWVRVDAAAFYEVSDRVSLQLNVENLFDRDYYSSAHGDNNIQPGDPFSVRLGVSLKL